MIDGGMAYSLRIGEDVLPARIEPYDLFWFEEPFEADDILSYERLTGSVAMRIACGEAHSNAATLSPARRSRRQYLAARPRSLRRHDDRARHRGVWSESSVRAPSSIPHCFSTDVLLAATLQFVSTLPGERLIEYPVTQSKRLGSLLTTPFAPDNGFLRVPDGPGLGITLDDDEVRRRTVVA